MRDEMFRETDSCNTEVKVFIWLFGSPRELTPSNDIERRNKTIEHQLDIIMIKFGMLL